MNIKEYILKNTKIRPIDDNLQFLPRRYGLGFVFENEKIEKRLLYKKEKKSKECTIVNDNESSDDVIQQLLYKRFKKSKK